MFLDVEKWKSVFLDYAYLLHVLFFLFSWEEGKGRENKCMLIDNNNHPERIFFLFLFLILSMEVTYSDLCFWSVI